MNHVVHSLINDVPRQAGAGMLELAQTFANAGMDQGTFNNLRQHLIQQAEEKTSVLFIKEKLTAIEQEMRIERTSIIH